MATSYRKLWTYTDRSNMATRMVQCYYSLFRPSWTYQIFSPRESFPTICKANGNITSHCVRQCPGYGSKAGDSTQDDQIIVPVDRLHISYSRSGGAGGQHVNKVSTKAEVRFHVYTADWIPDDVKENVILKNKNRINKAGELLVTSERTRSQHRNLGDCIQKISDIIMEASEKPHEPSNEDIALRASRLERRNQERLKEKKIQSAIKQSRRVDFD